MGGQASNSFLFGCIRAAHFTAGYIAAAGWLYRGGVAITGGKHAREILFVPVPDGAFWKELGTTIKGHLFIAKESHKTIGHNALARMTMGGRTEQRRVSMMLVDAQPVGTPLLVHTDVAPRVLSEEEVPLLEAALDGLEDGTL